MGSRRCRCAHVGFDLCHKYVLFLLLSVCIIPVRTPSVRLLHVSHAAAAAQKAAQCGRGAAVAVLVEEYHARVSLAGGRASARREHLIGLSCSLGGSVFVCLFVCVCVFVVHLFWAGGGAGGLVGSALLFALRRSRACARVQAFRLARAVRQATRSHS